jgi:hypothetical protein
VRDAPRPVQARDAAVNLRDELVALNDELERCRARAR